MIGDVVRVSNDQEYVMRHQSGHGDWVESMSMVSHVELCIL